MGDLVGWLPLIIAIGTLIFTALMSVIGYLYKTGQDARQREDLQRYEAQKAETNRRLEALERMGHEESAACETDRHDLRERVHKVEMRVEGQSRDMNGLDKKMDFVVATLSDLNQMVRALVSTKNTSGG